MTTLFAPSGVGLQTRYSSDLRTFEESELEPTEIVEVTPVGQDKFVTEWEINDEINGENCDEETVGLFE